METSNKYHEVLSSNIGAIRAVVSAVRGTIGPKGLDVMLVDEFGSFKCTNDGVEILSNIQIKHPAAKLIVEAARAQELKVGDGTTTVAILCDSILASALLRINSGSNPSRLAQGIKIATQRAREELSKIAHPIKDTQDQRLRHLVKISARGDELITSLIIEAAQRCSSNNKSQSYLTDENTGFNFADTIIGSTMSESMVIDGLFIKKRSHFSYGSKLQNLETLVIEGPFEPEPMSSEAVSTDEGVKKYEQNVQALLESAKRIAKSGVRAVFTSSSMLPIVEEFFAKENIFVLTHIKSSDISRLVSVSGARICNRNRLLNTDQSSFSDYSGKLTNITNRTDLGGFIIEGSKHYQSSILISAETETVLEEKKLIAIDAAKALIAALRSGYVVGEGIAEFNISTTIETLRDEHKNDHDISCGIEVVVEALKAPFHQIIENAGLTHNEIYYKLQIKPENLMGIDLDSGEAIDLVQAGIIDPLEAKLSALKIASEVACQILRINMIVQSK